MHFEKCYIFAFVTVVSSFKKLFKFNRIIKGFER